MENIDLRNTISFLKKNKEKKPRNIDLIKSYLISQPEKLKKLIQFYNKIIVIVNEFISISQMYSNKLKELALKIKMSEEEEKDYQLESQLFNIIKTTFFFNSESLNEIINDIKKGIALIDNESVKKTNENFNNLSKMYFLEINKVSTNQKKYEKEMKNYEEFLIDQEINNNKEGKKNVFTIYNAKGPIEAQDNYIKCIKESNNILKNIINISSEEKESIRKKINRKCIFLLDTLIFFTKKKIDNYELQKININQTYSSSIHSLLEEEELNSHIIHPVPYSLKCFDIFVKKKEITQNDSNEKQNIQKTEHNHNFCSLINDINNEDENKIKNKIQELKRENILNIFDVMKKNKLMLSSRDEKIRQNEISKKIIKQIITLIVKDIKHYKEEHKKKLFKLFDEDKFHISYFFKILNTNRGKQNKILNKDTFISLGEAFEYIAKISFDKNYIDIFKLLFILSTTYNYQDQESNKKEYLFSYIEKNTNFHKIEFWENYFNYLNIDSEKTTTLHDSIGSKNNKSSEEIKKEKEDKLRLSVFSNIMMVIQNMIDFHFDNDFIDIFISKMNDKYKLNEIELAQIKIYLDENKKENNEDNTINNNSNNNIEKIEIKITGEKGNNNDYDNYIIDNLKINEEEEKMHNNCNIINDKEDKK